jgi:hypothetical protein
MSKTLQFKVFCLEQYKNEHHISGAQTVKTFEDYGVFDYIGAFYDVLHSTGGKYIVEDIDMFIAARQ